MWAGGGGGGRWACLVFILGHEVALHVGGVGARGEVLALLLVAAEAALAVSGVGVLLRPAHKFWRVGGWENMETELGSDVRE